MDESAETNNAIRKEIQELLALGPLPALDSTDESLAHRIDHYADLLLSIDRPVTAEEAKALCTLFGPDDCGGVAWTLLHLIETAPNWPLKDYLLTLTDPPNSEWKWIERLKQRAKNAGLLD